MRSCRNARSARTANVALWAVAIPSAVEMFPSIPARPRLANVFNPLRAAPNASISRIGRDEAINSEAPSGKCCDISRAISGSDQVVISFTTLDARSEYLTHLANQQRVT